MMLYDKNIYSICTVKCHDNLLPSEKTKEVILKASEIKDSRNVSFGFQVEHCSTVFCLVNPCANLMLFISSERSILLYRQSQK